MENNLNENQKYNGIVVKTKNPKKVITKFCPSNKSNSKNIVRTKRTYSHYVNKEDTGKLQYMVSPHVVMIGNNKIGIYDCSYRTLKSSGIKFYREGNRLVFTTGVPNSEIEISSRHISHVSGTIEPKRVHWHYRRFFSDKVLESAKSLRENIVDSFR